MPYVRGSFTRPNRVYAPRRETLFSPGRLDTVRSEEEADGAAVEITRPRRVRPHAAPSGLWNAAAATGWTSKYDSGVPTGWDHDRVGPEILAPKDPDFSSFWSAQIEPATPKLCDETPRNVFF